MTPCSCYSRRSLPQPEMTHIVPSCTLVPRAGRQTGATLSENLTPAPPAFLRILTTARSWLKGPSSLQCGMCVSRRGAGYLLVARVHFYVFNLKSHLLRINLVKVILANHHSHVSWICSTTKLDLISVNYLQWVQICN